MSRVVYEFHIKNYVVLKLDEMPKKAYRLFLIDGKKYSPIADLRCEKLYCKLKAMKAFWKSD